MKTMSAFSWFAVRRVVSRGCEVLFSNQSSMWFFESTLFTVRSSVSFGTDALVAGEAVDASGHVLTWA